MSWYYREKHFNTDEALTVQTVYSIRNEKDEEVCEVKTKADAILISVAPELFEQLEILIRDTNHCSREYIDKIIEAGHFVSMIKNTRIAEKLAENQNEKER